MPQSSTRKFKCPMGHLAVTHVNGRMFCSICGFTATGKAKAAYLVAVIVEHVASMTPPDMSAEAEKQVKQMNARLSGLQEPRTKAAWKAAVDLARGLLVFEQAGCWKLAAVPAIDGARCREILKGGQAYGVVPSSRVVDQMVRLIA